MNKARKGNHAGFTLIELLVVITIIIILGIIVLVTINPFQAQAQARDSDRLSDINNLRDALNLGITDNSSNVGAFLCSAAATPPNNAAPCSGNSASGSRAVNGTGWLPVNLASVTSVTISTLPIDPGTNVAPYVYSYKTNAGGTGYELDTVFESDKYVGKMANAVDGGNNANAYEVGTDLTILP